jgi:hypothetical protein
LDWPSLVKRYVWDDDKTPYLVRPGALTPVQARSELFVYAVLLSILAAGVTVVAAVGETRVGALASPVVVAHALSVVVAAIALGLTGHPSAALYCASAPLALVIGALAGLVRPGMTGGERVVLAAAGVVWVGYAARVIRIARRLHGRD